MIINLSNNNKKIKDLIKIRDDAKFRNDKSLFYVEGLKIVLDTPFELINEIYLDSEFYNFFLKEYPIYKSKNIYILTSNLFKKVKNTINSQGIIAIVKYNLIHNLQSNFLSKIKNCIILDAINDPGNLGTIIRLSEATNIDLIILANNCCNVYNPKVIRATMSAIFRTNIYISNNIINTINELKTFGFNIFATSLSNEAINFTHCDLKSKNAIIFGNEAYGVKRDLINISNTLIKIPMYGKIESLNVAISASIICYEVLRQNNAI